MLKFKIIGLALALVLIAGLVAVASGATGAYFTDKKSGDITGSIGTIRIAAGANVDTGGGLHFTWSNMMPGEHYSATVHYLNTGNNPQDVYLHFYNVTALSCLNSLGRYGALRIADSNTGEVFYSSNLNDHPDHIQTYPAADQATVPLPKYVKLASGVAPNGTGHVTLTFSYASRMQQPEPGAVFNMYPAPVNPSDIDPANATGFGQVHVVAGETGEGLPFEVVATQVGVAPDATGSYADH